MLKWDNQSPISFQSFPNSYFGRENVAKFQVDDDLAFAKEANMSVYPHHVSLLKCGMLILDNLAESEWILVNCTYRLVPILVCAQRSQNGTPNIEANTKSVHEDLVCPEQSLHHNNTCYNIAWISLGNSTCIPFSSVNFTSLMHSLCVVFEAVSAVWPPIHANINPDGTVLRRFEFVRHLKLSLTKFDIVSLESAEGFGISIAEKHLVWIVPVSHACRNVARISITLVCDGKADCPGDLSDENYCICNKSSENKTDTKHTFCKEYVFQEDKTCSDLYYSNRHGNCEKYSSMTKRDKLAVKNFACTKSGRVIDHALVNDLVADCGPTAEDEDNLASLLRYGFDSSCSDEYLLPCKQGHSKCYRIPDICTYQLDLLKNLHPCRNGGHLEQCWDFTCNMKFKCYFSYCIPWSLVCDGKWDCPDGGDESHEQCLNHSLCAYMFKCRNTPLCLHVGNVCNGFHECPEQDDEHLCDLMVFKCLRNCHCLAYGILCVSTPMTTQRSVIYPFHLVSAYKSQFVLDQNFLNQFPNVVILKLTHNAIREICFQMPKGIFVLDVSLNHIVLISKHCFYSLNSLEDLKLDFNNISTLQPYSFTDLFSLKRLSIANNLVSTFIKHIIFNSPSFLLLDIRAKNKMNVDVDSLVELNVKAIKTTDYHVCCVAPADIICTAKTPWYRSCSDLLYDQTIRVFYLVVPILLLGVNLISIGLHRQTRVSREAYVAIVVAVNCNDLQCAVYLATIWGADFNFKGTFRVKEETWRSGPLCFSAFEIALCFTILTQLLLLFLSLSRLMIVIKPIGSDFKRFSFVFKKLLYLSITSFIFSLFLTLVAKFVDQKLSVSLCLPFIDPTKRLNFPQSYDLVHCCYSVIDLISNFWYAYNACP